jgi:hypothetical protein
VPDDCFPAVVRTSLIETFAGSSLLCRSSSESSESWKVVVFSVLSF